MVRKGGLEPPHLSVPDPKSGASANSATFANQNSFARRSLRIARDIYSSHKHRLGEEVTIESGKNAEPESAAGNDFTTEAGT